MLFNSFEFLVFFPTVVGLYFLLPHRFRWVLLLISSYAFYMFWRAAYAIILLVSTVVDYTCGRMMGRYTDSEKYKRKPWLWLSLISNLGILVAFKYFNFFSDTTESLSRWLGIAYAAPAFELLLPMGISFYTFQTMSYSIDVYHGRIKPEKHLGIFALFISFFPQLVAGPIERAGNLLGQLKQRHEFNYQRVTSGLRLMTWGLMKKVVIADRLALMVNQVYNDPTAYEGIPLIIATVFFAFQIYCDFSGYSDMAIGAARVMGFKLMENFRRPYFAASIREFWARWHISLSTWFRDYLYIPLGGSRVVKWRWYYNLFITFVISGFWHGANWTFIVWGALHGIFLIAGEVIKNQSHLLPRSIGLAKLPQLQRFMQVAAIFILVCLAWVFFRANSITDALYICSHMISGLSDSVNAIVHDTDGLRNTWLFLGQTRTSFLIACGVILLLVLVEWLLEHQIRLRVASLPAAVRIAAYGAVVAFIYLFGSFKETEFIYFQF
ncbi:MBOAT family O-acyltransferase [Pontibacter cellulosilyticus]|uniref:MBOAT family protein n=1 Tax=Pontibacter cellulosilyticus TaxID=1720253 RepID=A0A923NA31_9BACT|nr:MBOAT family O-acyltransferase [Pontibacter cellulosilyticus]MBC5994984.1 MBOAT family protein [Pontibacter cellulosilyticus]